MEIAVSVIGAIRSCLCSPKCADALFVRCKHMISVTKEIRNLEKVKSKLVAQVADVKRRLHTEEKEQGKLRTSVTEKWLNDAKEALDETDDTKRKVRKAKRCLNGLLPNCCSRSTLGQRILELIKEVTALSVDGDRLSVESLALQVPRTGMRQPTIELVGETTALKTSDMIWECLMDDKNWIVGVYGMGGVGKTTIMKGINNQLLEQQHLFLKVIWVTVSKELNVHKLQDNIAKQVNLDLSNEDDEIRRSLLLHDVLDKKGRIVFILDDMWEAFSLHEIGIPSFTKESGCKLVFTTRSSEVCLRMGCNKPIKVELLSDGEAWNLFIKTVGLKLLPEVEKIARQVAKQCAGLPLAIITVGGAMKGRDEILDWRVALTDLQESTKWILNMEEQVIEILKFSYNCLGDDILKKCFLYCALYPEDYEINSEELIDNWVMEGLIKGDKIGDELDLGQFILSKLKHCSLIESELVDGGLWKYVKMHDLTRAMALHITKVNPQFIVKAGKTLKNLVDEREWGENLEKVSFMECNINQILISPSCHGLTTMLLNRTPLKHIAHDFFVQLQDLRVLNLSNTEIELLPESVSDLVNLHVLDLSWCKLLKRVPSVEKLHSLWVLRLVETAIEELPHGMEALVNLQRLDLTRTRLRELPPSLISKFSLLQELHVYPLRLPISFADELLSLTHLENLSISFNDLSDLSYYVGLENFNNFTYFFFNVRHDLDMSEFHPRKRRSVTVRNDSNHFPELQLPQNVEYLGIMEFSELTRLSELACLKNVRELKKCFIRECSRMEYIVFSEEDYLLKDLEYIGIKKCHKLITLYKGLPAHGTLSCLKKLHISKCDNLKYLFSLALFEKLQNLVEIYIDCCELEDLLLTSEEEMDQSTTFATSSLKKLKLLKLPKLKTLFSKRALQYFQNLEEVHIMYCDGLKELVAEEAGSEMSTGSTDNNRITLPRLNKLDLVNLPELKNIWKGEMFCDSLQSVRVSNCPELKRLPQFIGEDQTPPPVLKEIKGSREWWDSLNWDGPFARYILQPLFQVHW